MVGRNETIDRQKLTRLWAEGYSAGQIAYMLGVSRNTVIGQVKRMHLPNPTSKQPRKASPYVRDERYHTKTKEPKVGKSIPVDANVRHTIDFHTTKPIAKVKQLGLSKFELYRQLNQAVRNTAAMTTPEREETPEDSDHPVEVVNTQPEAVEETSQSITSELEIELVLGD